MIFRVKRAFFLLFLFFHLIHFQTSIVADEISFFNTNIKDVLNTLAMEYEKVILYEPNITGAVSLSIPSEDVDFERLLTLILLPYNYYWTKMDNIYFVGIINPNSPAFVNVARLYEIPLKFVNSDKVYEMIPNVFRDYIVKRTNMNSLIVYAPVPIVSKIADIVSNIDKPLERRSIEIKIIDVSEKYLNSFADEFSVLSSAQVVPFIPNLVQIPLFGIVVNLFSNSKQENEDFKVIYEGLINALNGYDFKVSTQKEISVNKFIDGKYTTTQSKSEVTLQFTPRFLYKSCLLDIDIQISGLPSSVDANLNTKGSNLKTVLRLDYGQVYLISTVSYERIVEKEGGVFILKDLPVIGSFFKRYYYETEKRYLLFFVSVGDKQ